VEDVHDFLEFLLPLVAAVIAVFPFTVLSITYRRTRSTRILLASFAFAGFVAKGLILSLGFLTDALSSSLFEIVEFASDIAIIGLFATALSWQSGETHARSP